MGTLDVEERREDLFEGEGERDLAAWGESERFTSEPGVDARELALLKGSDLARVLFRLRAVSLLEMVVRIHWTAYICLAGSAHLFDARVWVAQSLPAVKAVRSQC